MQGATEKSQLWYQNFKSFADNTRNNKNNNKKNKNKKQHWDLRSLQTRIKLYRFQVL